MTLYSIAKTELDRSLMSYTREDVTTLRCVCCDPRALENRIGRFHGQIHDGCGVALSKQCDKSIEGPVQSLSKGTQHHVLRMLVVAWEPSTVRLTSVVHDIGTANTTKWRGCGNAVGFSINAYAQIEYLIRGD